MIIYYMRVCVYICGGTHDNNIIFLIAPITIIFTMTNYPADADATSKLAPLDVC